MTSCHQVVPSLSPELSYSTDAPNEQQLKELLDSLAQDVFPAGTDICDLYTADLYSTAPQFLNGMQSESFTKSMLATVGDRTPGAQTSLQHHWPFYCNGMEFPPVAGHREWGSTLREDTKSVQCPVPPQDPRNWSVEHVQHWLVQSARDHRLGSIDYKAFAVNGERLCSFTRFEFKQRAPLAGDILFSLLASLKTGHLPTSSPHQQRSLHHSNVWYPKEMGAPTSPPCLESAADAFSDCSSTSSCYFDERDRARMSSSPPVNASPFASCSVADSMHLASGASLHPSAFPGVNYTPLTGIAQSLPVCESVMLTTSTGPTALSAINPFPRTTYKSPKDAPPTHLRTFLKEILSNKMFAYCIEWADESKGIFRILNSEEVARFWGIRKNRPKMNYDKLSRSLRFYYKKGLLKKVPGQRLVYQFTEPSANATDEGKKDLKQSDVVKSSK